MRPLAGVAVIGACIAAVTGGAVGACGSAGDSHSSPNDGSSGSSSGASGSSGGTSGSSSGTSGGNDAGSDSGKDSGGDAGPRTYTTQFPLTENPISEGANWIGGHAAGQACAGGYCWGNVQTEGGLAHGVDEPTQFGDPTAILTGAWGASQTVSATVKAPVPAPTGGCCMEAEVRLRFSISPGLATGYEVYCSVVASNKYCHIASWGGPDGAYVNLDGPQWDTGNPDCPGFPVTGPQVLKDGDVLSATVSGSNPVTVTGSINGVPFVTVVDKGKCHFNPPNSGPYGPWPGGAPGLGFFGSNFATFGFTAFGAAD